MAHQSRRAFARRCFRLGIGPSTTWVPPNGPRLPCRVKKESALCATPPLHALFLVQHREPPGSSYLQHAPTLQAPWDVASLGLRSTTHRHPCRASRVSFHRRTHGHVGRGCYPSGRRRRSRGPPRAWSRRMPSSPSLPCPTAHRGPWTLGGEAQACAGFGDSNLEAVPYSRTTAVPGLVPSPMSAYSQALPGLHPRAFHG